MKFKAKFDGRSGCPINIFENEGRVYVNKLSASISYNNRLTRQAYKQRSFNSLFFECSSLRSPAVFGTGITQDGLAYFDMEYAMGEKFSDYLPTLSIHQLDSIIEIFTDYFNASVEKSILLEVPFEVIVSKIEEVKQKVISMEHYSEGLKSKLFNYLLFCKPEAHLPQGYCHGDFTFSNMLFKEDGQIFVFDFLDSFIESPLIDLVKLRQDTKFFWSVLSDENLEPFKITKVLQILNYMDLKLDDFLRAKGYDFKSWYSYLEVFNLARIMPYASKQSDIQFLNNNLTLLLYNK